MKVTTFFIMILSYAQCFAAPDNATDSISNDRKSKLIHMVKQDCGSCHGMTLKGGLGPSLLPETVASKPAVYLQMVILNGISKTAMPPWKDHLTQQEALWISTTLQQGLNHAD